MTNKEFEADKLNHKYIQFYRDSVISLHAAFISRGHSTTDARYSAIEQSQFLMEEMGYTNSINK